MIQDSILEIEHSIKEQISFLESRNKKLRFVFRHRKVFNEGSEFMLTKSFWF